MVRRVPFAVIAAVAAVAVAGDARAVKPRGAHVVAFRVNGLQEIAVVPKDVAPEGERAMVLFLYGRGGHASDQLSNQAFFDELSKLGNRAPVFVFAESNDHSYWHDRDERKWGAYLFNHVIPKAVDQFKLDRTRIAVGGISMGGFGALDLARLHPGAFCAAAGHSPAIWRTFPETAAGAFDDEQDFGAHNLVAAKPAVWASTRHLWLDAGTEDPFDPGDKAWIARVRKGDARLVVHRWAGGHDGSYWAEHWPAYVRYYARALGDCATVTPDQ